MGVTVFVGQRRNNVVQSTLYMLSVKCSQSSYNKLCYRQETRAMTLCISCNVVLLLYE